MSIKKTIAFPDELIEPIEVISKAQTRNFSNFVIHAVTQEIKRRGNILSTCNREDTPRAGKLRMREVLTYFEKGYADNGNSKKHIDGI